MTRFSRRIALLLSLPLVAIGCQSPDRPAAQSLPPPDDAAAREAAFQPPAPATVEVVNQLNAIDTARAIVGNNIANAETTAFKATRVAFQNGGKLHCQFDLTQGSLENTGRPLDVGIQGQGFFAVKTLGSLGNGTAYTRNGNFVVSKKGELVLNVGDGYRLIPPITIPQNATDIAIGVDGKVSVLIPGTNAKQEAGVLQLTQFVNPEALQLQGGSIITETEASGPPTTCNPGDGGTGQIFQGFLEASNVDPIRERRRLQFLNEWRATLMRMAGEPPSLGESIDATDATH